MVVEESIHVIYDECNNSLQERKSFDDDLGLETSMGKLQIEDKRQQEEIGENPKKEVSPLALLPPQQVQGESIQDLPKDWMFVINHPQDQIIVDENWMIAMQEELNQFERSETSNQTTKGRNLHQSSKIYKRSSKRFNMEDAKTMKTPMSSSIKLDKDEKGERRLLLGHRASALQSCLNLFRRRLAKGEVRHDPLQPCGGLLEIQE
ncbi:hypothetical protein CK203_104144 [Vitis vinifera]|uniref:Uncharacterized protein n=1 Tax=Vitis vinifera TaxID=29760 RepID=A0A438FHM5_VITVI|nr:hypothetical protein CK203_104144 [Vitis vinifera]